MLDKKRFNNFSMSYLIIAINVLVYILMTLAGGSYNTQVLVKFGAMVRAHIIIGEYYRFITPIFIHIGLIHLLLNCYAIYILGRNFELIYGHLRFILIYLLSGIMGNIFSFAFQDLYTVSAGASTSIYGIFGLALGFIVFYHEDSLLKNYGRAFLPVIAINLVYTLIAPNIGLWGHLGGLVGGFLLSGIVPNIRGKARFSVRLVASLVFIGLAFFLIVKGFSILYI